MKLPETTLLKRSLFYGLIAGSLAFTSCDNNDDGPSSGGDSGNNSGPFFISAVEDDAEYLLTTDNIEEGTLSLAGNGRELDLSGYTWIFNDDPSLALGLIYQQGDPGIGLGYTANNDWSLNEIGQFQISTRFTSYGFFDKYAITSVGGQTPTDENGNALTDDNGNERTDGVIFNFIDIENGLAMEQKLITTLDVFEAGEQATPSGIADLGNGEFLTGLVVSQPKDPEAGGGASTGTITYPDNVWVARFDTDLNLKHVYKDDRISYASGRFRSQYYSQIGRDDQGNVYVFSGAYESTSTLPAGALRINKGADDFDPDYYVNIEELTGGYKFRKVWHIRQDYFLLEVYNDLEVASTGAATQYGIIKMQDKTFNWVSGIPAKDKITGTGLPAAHDGKMYFPITEEGENPVIYIINPEDATASKGLAVAAAEIRAIGVLSN